jgi:hypothetical protein
MRPVLGILFGPRSPSAFAKRFVFKEVPNWEPWDSISNDEPGERLLFKQLRQKEIGSANLFNPASHLSCVYLLSANVY